MEANRAFSVKAQEAAQRNEYFTQQMHKIAKKTMHVAEATGNETVSMRIITLVTLFYLPGTFVSVSFPNCVTHMVELNAQADSNEHGCGPVRCTRPWNTPRKSLLFGCFSIVP